MPSFSRGLQPQVTIHDFAVASNQAWDFEAEFADRCAHAIHGGIVLSGVAGVENQTIDWPDLNFRRRRRRNHPSRRAAN
jgi:hypothetical protein